MVCTDNVTRHGKAEDRTEPKLLEAKLRYRSMAVMGFSLGR